LRFGELAGDGKGFAAGDVRAGDVDELWWDGGRGCFVEGGELFAAIGDKGFDFGGDVGGLLDVEGDA
jgi:hypothetical protein